MRLHPISGTFRTLALAAVCSAMVSALPLVAQDSSAPPPAAQDNQGPPQGRPDPAQMQARRLEMMTRRLNLSPDQASQIKAIDADQMTQMRGLRDDSSMSRDDKHAKMQSIHEASNEKIRAVLNDEQKAKYDAMEAQRRDRMHDHGNGQDGQGAPPAPPKQ